MAHTAICVGYSSNGTPLVAAHNSNFWEAEWTLGGASWWGGSTRRVTILMPDPQPVHWYDNLTPVDLGTDFYAFIINTSVWRNLTNDRNNVSSRIETGNANQVWRFEKQDDISYKITNCADGNVLDDEYFGQENGTNVAVATNNNSNAQRWYVYGTQGNYYIRSKCGDKVIDLNYGSSEEGTNIQLWQKEDNPNQKFYIWNLQTSACEVNVVSGSTSKLTSVSWTNADNAWTYSLKLWKGEYWNGTPYKVYDNIKGNSINIDLPPGYYEGYIDAVNDYYFTMSKNIIKFTVCEDIVDIGNDVKCLIINSNKDRTPWKPLMQDDTGNVVLGDELRTNYDSTLWHLMKNEDDGTYTIYSYKNGKVLDVDSGMDVDGLNVHCYKSNGKDNQRWYLIKRTDGTFRLRAKCCQKVIDIAAENGTNAQIWSYMDNIQQSFVIYSLQAERDKLNYSIFSDKSKISLGEEVNITIGGNIPYVYNYKFHILDSFGNETVVDNLCNLKYVFKGNRIGKYTIYAEITSPVDFQKGSISEKSISINVIGKKGDVNFDKTVNIKDTVLMQRYLLGMVSLNAQQLECADYNNDGKFSLADVVAVQRYIMSV